MAQGPAPNPPHHLQGHASAVIAGRALLLTFFIPPLLFKYRNGETFDVFAKERPQARIVQGHGKKPFPQFYTPAKTRAWEEHIGQHALVQLRTVEVDGDRDFTLPVKNSRYLVNLRFNIRKPVSYPKSVIHAVKKPDLDNLLKAVLDGLVVGGIIDDDNAITDLSVCKRYANDEHPLGVEVEITCLPV